MFNKLGIKSKLLIAFSSIAFVSVIVGGVSYSYSSRVIGIYRSIAKENVPNLVVFIDMKAALSEMVIPTASLVGSPTTPEEAAKAKTQLDDAIGRFQKAAKEYESSHFSPGEEPIWLDFKNEHLKQFIELSNEMIRLSGTNKKEDQTKRDQLWDGEFAKCTTARKAAFLKLAQYQLDDSAKKELEGDRLNKQMNIAVFIIVATGFGLAVLIGYMIATFLSRELASVASSLASGANEVNAAVTQLSSASEELSTASNQQAASVQETATAVEEINAMVQKNAQSATESADVSAQAKTQAEHGKQAVDRMTRSMDEIHRSNQDIQSQTEEGNRKISEIVQVIQEIGNKTKVINDIVFQTKLLSFNASVEAARAGEHGKGFAVVAEEVGNLAQMSGNSAKEIGSLLEESIRKVESVVTDSKQAVERLMQQARTNVEHGGKTANECGQSLTEIVTKVQRLSEMVGGISSASQEQSRGVGEISKAVQEIDHATQANASAAQQTAASANQLSSQIAALQSASERLRTIVEGENNRIKTYLQQTAFATPPCVTEVFVQEKELEAG